MYEKLIILFLSFQLWKLETLIFLKMQMSEKCHIYTAIIRLPSSSYAMVADYDDEDDSDVRAEGRRDTRTWIHIAKEKLMKKCR